MTTKTLINTDFTTDPGIQASSPKAANRPYDGTNDRWTCYVERVQSETSWAFFDLRDYGGPAGGFNSDLRPEFYNRHYTTSWSNTALGWFGLHHDPTDKLAPDMPVNFLGYRFYRDASNAREIRAAIADNEGNLYLGDPVWPNPATDYDIDMIYIPETGHCRIRVYNHVGGAYIGQSNAYLPAGKRFENLTMIGSRDRENDGDFTTPNVSGYIDDLQVDWVLPEDKWVLWSPLGSVVLEELRLWNRGQEPRHTIIDGQGRPWSSVYWDGCGPHRIEMEGTFLRDLATLDAIEEIMEALYSRGETVELYSPEPNYTMDDAIITAWDFPREFQRLDNRDFVLEVSSRRAPSLS